MSLSIGIVGLPNVGKSTLFNILTKQEVPAANYPFCTIDPNIGVVPVRDERLQVLANIIHEETGINPPIVPATVTFVDIAGLVSGASKGEGLGNKFLSHIKEVDVIVHVVRFFQNDNITHVANKVDPISDIETINTELMLKDIETLDAFLLKNKGKEKNDKEYAELKPILDKLALHLAEGKRALDLLGRLDLSPNILKNLKKLSLLTFKPTVYLANVSEDDINISGEKARTALGLEDDEHVLALSLKLEEELSSLSDEDKITFMEEFGLSLGGLEKLVSLCYKLLGLISFFTAGKKEIRAWTIKRGSWVEDAAGTIHTDFKQFFIKAEILPYKDFIKSHGWQKARDKGLVKLEGRRAVVNDGDVIIFKHGAK